MSNQSPYPYDSSIPPYQQGNANGQYQYPSLQPPPNTNYASPYDYPPSEPYSPPPPLPRPAIVYQVPSYAVAQPQGGNGPAIASLVLGIVGVVWFWIPIVGLIISIVGLVMASVGMRRQTTGRGMAIAGLVLSIIGVVLGVCYFAYYASLIVWFSHYHP